MKFSKKIIFVILATFILNYLTIFLIQSAEEIKSEQNIFDRRELSSDEPEKRLPKMIELGSVKCKACKAMEHVIEELKEKYSDKLIVEFIDVMQNPQPGEKYQINTIPTQVFLDADGKELFRHTGFFSKDAILAKWKELGYDFEKQNKDE